MFAALLLAVLPADLPPDFTSETEVVIGGTLDYVNDLTRTYRVCCGSNKKLIFIPEGSRIIINGVDYAFDAAGRLPRSDKSQITIRPYGANGKMEVIIRSKHDPFPKPF
jgi:hypothetical protein